MKINKIESFANEFVGFVRVTAEDGMQGWGQASTYHSDITAQVLHRQVAPWVLGQDTTDLDDLLDLVTEREHKFPGSYLRRAMGGFDTAVWDMRGKRAGKPVAELLGGSAGPIRAYASSMKRDITPADEAARLKRLRDEKGFDAFKVRAGAEVGRGVDETVAMARPAPSRSGGGWRITASAISRSPAPIGSWSRPRRSPTPWIST
jgi:L-alanine-DL-glutamate epimerase-like enolase superfamily enzyme